MKWNDILTKRWFCWPLLWASLFCLTIPNGVSGVPEDEAKAAGKTIQDFPLADYDYFRLMDNRGRDENGNTRLLELNDEEVKGRNAWMMWAGGNEAFWDWLARNGYGTIDLLRLLDSNDRGRRFKSAGLITEPGTRPPTPEETEKAYGVRYDRPVDAQARRPDPEVYGYSSGIVGLRLFPNKAFSGSARSRWDPQRYYSDPKYSTRPDTIRPYRVAMSCAFCHVGPHPLNPPADPEEPRWENLSGTIGSQYMRIRAVFGNMLQKNNLLYHVLDSQMPGTIDTSLVASDNLNNANTMNAVFGIPWRVERALHNTFETLSPESNVYPGLPPLGLEFEDYFNGNPRAVPRVLLDGSDSVGVYVALARVYLNIGTYYEQWIRLHNPLLGFRPQASFKLKDCDDNSIYWAATRERVAPLAKFFLKSTDPMRLKDAPGGRVAGGLQGNGLPWDSAYELGRNVFAEGCIACHSSIQPGDRPDIEAQLSLADLGSDIESRKSLRLGLEDLARLTRGDGKLPPHYAQWARKVVHLESFWNGNYLSTDRRIPVSLVRANSARAMASNARHGQMWEDFSSLTYKELPSVGPIPYRDPFSGANKFYKPPSGGPGYYRVPTLISAWATAPFLHNNALGIFNNDPSVHGRLVAFTNAIEKLFWPQKRLEGDELASAERRAADGGLVWRTSQESYFMFFGHHIPMILSGVTGWEGIWVAVFPWVPSIVFLILAVILLLLDRIVKFRLHLEAKWPWLERHLSKVRWVSSALSFLLFLGSVVLIVKFSMKLRVFDAMLGVGFPWLRIQAWLVPFFFVVLAFVFHYHWFNIRPALARKVTMWVGAACVIASILVAISFGRFFSGQGHDVTVGPFPQGIPVNAIANMDPKAPLKARKAAVLALVDYLVAYHEAPEDAKPGQKEFEARVAPALMNASKCPDFVMDRGHYYEFMRHWSDEEKQALIALIKTF